MITELTIGDIFIDHEKNEYVYTRRFIDDSYNQFLFALKDRSLIGIGETEEDAIFTMNVLYKLSWIGHISNKTGYVKTEYELYQKDILIDDLRSIIQYYKKQLAYYEPISR